MMMAMAVANGNPLGLTGLFEYVFDAEAGRLDYTVTVRTASASVTMPAMATAAVTLSVEDGAGQGQAHGLLAEPMLHSVEYRLGDGAVDAAAVTVGRFSGHWVFGAAATPAVSATEMVRTLDLVAAGRVLVTVSVSGANSSSSSGAATRWCGATQPPIRWGSPSLCRN
jgi:Zn-dependent protease